MAENWNETKFVEELIREAHASARIATQDLEEVPQLSEASRKVLYHAAYRFYSDGVYEKAEEFFRFLTILDGQNAGYWLGLGAARQMRERYDPALEAYALSAIIQPSDPRPHLHAAECYFQQKNKTDGVKALELADELCADTGMLGAIRNRIDVMREAWNLPSRQSN